jgi:hypothetical protein
MLEALSEEDRQQVERLTEEFRAKARTWQADANKNRVMSAGPSSPPPLAEPHGDLLEKDQARPGTLASDGRLEAERP